MALAQSNGRRGRARFKKLLGLLPLGACAQRASKRSSWSWEFGGARCPNGPHGPALARPYVTACRAAIHGLHGRPRYGPTSPFGTAACWARGPPASAPPVEGCSRPAAPRARAARQPAERAAPAPRGILPHRPRLLPAAALVCSRRSCSAPPAAPPHARHGHQPRRREQTREAAGRGVEMGEAE